jgi:hypothetical protein
MLQVTHNVCPTVGSKLPSEPIFAAAITCTAHPQSMEATLAMEPMVLASRECSMLSKKYKIEV